MATTWQARALQTSAASGLFYTSFFSVTAFQLFNMTAWLETRGIDAVTAGRMQGSADLVFVIGVLLAGLMADWRGFNRRLFLGFFAFAILGYAILGATTQVALLTMALAFMSFAFMPLTNLMDTHLQPYITRDLIPYARVRAAGSFSFAAVIFVLAFLEEATILKIFYPAICLSLAALGLSLLMLPAHPVHTPSPFTERLKTFGQLLSQPRFLLFYIVVALIFGSHGAHYIYAVPIWREATFSSALIYGVIAWSVLVEIMFFLVAPKALTEQRAVPLLALCTVAAIIRWIAWPFVDGWTGMLAVHSLHVFTFALTHLTTLAFLRRRVPEGQLGAAQALLPAISVGFGMASSKLIAAQAFGYGVVPTFWAMAIFASLALPLLWLLQRRL